MGKDVNDPFAGLDDDTLAKANDIFDDVMNQQSSITPGLGVMKTTGTAKLLVVVFVVDCSTTMAGDRIGAVNAALDELKYKLTEIKRDNGLDLKLALMSFTSSAKWEIKLTDIEEVNIEKLNTRPGLTEYGTAFHELNKVLRKDNFMKHTGKVAPPAVMFLTDGEPTDDYQYDLDELLKNGWFANASRSAVLLGDAINSPSAREAVSRFVKNPNTDIVTAEESTVIMQAIELATIHTVAGNPANGNQPQNQTGNPTANPTPNPAPAPAPAPDPVPDPGKNPFGDPSGTTDPKDPFKDDPFKDFPSGADPIGTTGSTGTTDPFGTTGSAGTTDPFGTTGSADTTDLFGSAGSADTTDPFATAGSSGTTDPFAGMDPL